MSGAGASDRESPLPAGRLSELVRVFLKIGTIGFGGPAAHIALMRHEVVARRRWLSDEEFVDLLGATSLIPGPNSTEMAIYIGLRRAGWRGLIAAGLCFIAPATFIVAALAWIYVRYGSAPAADSLLYGVAPVMIAVVLHAVWALARTAIRGAWLGAVALAAFVLYLANVNEIALLAAGGILVAVVANRHRIGFDGPSAVLPFLAALLGAGPAAGIARITSPRAVEMGRLFWSFLKTGALLYGSGYVLLAFLRRDLVEGLGWLTNRELIDGIAIGQLTPGPLFSTATFIGYLLKGPAGAALATLGIFLPSFVLVAAVGPLVPRLRRSAWVGAALDGVNAVALALMAGVSVELARTALVDVFTVSLAVAALVALAWAKLNPGWLVLAGALVGLARVAVVA